MLGCSFSMLTGWNGWPGLLACLFLMPVAVYICIRLGNARRRNTDRKDSLAILQRRLASGEISTEEFANLKQYL